jgi:hypothetical protein
LSGDGHELRAVLPVGAVLVGEAEIGFVHEGGGLESVAGALLLHVVAGETTEFGVDEWQELLQGVAAA